MTEKMKLEQPIDLSDSNRPIIMVDDEELDFMIASRFYKRSELTNPFLHFLDGDKFIGFLGEVKQGIQPMPVLVMMDINMPFMGGFEVIKKMREDSTFDEVPVVTMLTSSSDKSDKERALEIGVCNYLVKPFNPRDYKVFFDMLAD